MTMTTSRPRPHHFRPKLAMLPMKPQSPLPHGFDIKIQLPINVWFSKPC